MDFDKSLRVSFAFRDEQGNVKPEINIDFPTTRAELWHTLKNNGGVLIL